MRITQKARLIMLVALAFVVIFALSALGGCKKNTVGEYYLSVYANGAWTSYDSNSDIPTANKFVADSAKDNVYHLTIDLEEGAKVKIAQVGSSDTYGGEELFGSSELTAGADNAIVVGKSGKYEFSFDLSAKEISFKFTAKQTQGGDACGNPNCDCTDCTGENCNCGNTDGGPTAMLVEIDGITGSSSETILYNATKQLTATVTYDDATTSKEGIVWVSSDEKVATVANGLVSGVSAGTTQIKAKYGELESDALTVNVNGVVTLDHTSLTLNVGETQTIVATELGGAEILSWRSSDTDKAVVELGINGAVTAKGVGKATITVDYYQRPNSLTSVSCEVSVNTPVEGINIPSTLIVGLDGEQDLVVSFVPSDATNKNYTFTVEQDDEYISVVKNGTTLNVSGLKEGSAIITVTSEEGEFTKSCVVTVIDADSEFANDINPQTLTINKSGIATLSISGSGIASVAWTSSATAIVTVSAGEDTKTATVTGAGFGTATITATVTFASGDTTIKTLDVLVAPEQMWVYGDIIEGSSNGWNLTDSYDKAEEQGLTLTSTERGIYTGEFHLVANKDFRFAHDNFDWKGIRYEHLSSVTSEKQNVVQGGRDGNDGYNLQVTKAGTYAITVDFTAGKPILKIVCVSVDVTGVGVSADQSTLTSNGEVTTAEITLTINPNDATYNEEDIVWTLTNETLVDKNLSNGNKTITITVKGDLEEGGTVRVTVTLKEKSAYVDITIVAAGAQITPVESIEFEHSSYAFNVNNNGSFNGVGTVVARVNADATNQGVTYSTSDSGITIDSATGVITATKVGTYTIIATAAGDSSKTTTCTVTFYSDMFYLTGDANEWGDAGDNTTTVGTKFENYTFVATDDSNTIFELKVAISSANSKFQIMFIGGSWDLVIKGDNATLNGVTADSSNNFVLGTAGLYTITLDISNVKPLVKAEREGAIPTYTASLMKGEETVQTSGNSVVSSNRYSMSVEVACEEAEYTIVVGSVMLKINSITGDTSDDTTLFTIADNTLTCVTAGNYRITILYNPTDSSCAISIEVLKDTWTPIETYTLDVYSYLNQTWNTTNTTKTLKGYYNSLTGQYKLYFSYEFVATESICFGLKKDGSWVADVKSWNVTFSVVADSKKVSSTLDTKNGGYAVGEEVGECFFELTFTVSGSTYNLISLYAGDVDTNPNT